MKGKEKRMAGDYEIIQSVYIGDKEVVLGENPADTSDGKYLCSLCQHSDLVALHQDLFISDNYLEVMKIFGERIVHQAEKVRQELSAAEAQGVSTVPLSAADCIPLSPSDIRRLGSCRTLQGSMRKAFPRRWAVWYVSAIWIR